MVDSVDRLYEAVLAARTRDPAYSRTAKLIQEGMAKMAKKLAEEAVEVGLDAVQGNREAVIQESADLIYNLVVVLVEAGSPRRGLARDGPARAALRHRREAGQERARERPAQARENPRLSKVTGVGRLAPTAQRREASVFAMLDMIRPR